MDAFWHILKLNIILSIFYNGHSSSEEDGWMVTLKDENREILFPEKMSRVPDTPDASAHYYKKNESL